MKLNRKVIAKEWIIFISSFVFGILILPAILTLLFTQGLKELGGFYEALFENRDFLVPWLVVFSPYFFIQIIRATYWSIKQMKRQ
jgi:hypothetical protein